ncbi:hypothetical protein IJG72_04215 [bacterium]|nr:hypothetical protein [bacterium]
MRKINRKNVLIIGKSAKEYAFAKKLSELDYIENIFVASGNDGMKEFCKCIDIREDSPFELLEFVIENNVDLTIALSEKAIKADVVGFFTDNGQQIFGPTSKSAEICTCKSYGKKFMYKLRIPTPRFGIFEKSNLATDYVRNTQLPIVAKTDEFRGVNGTLVCSSFDIAKSFIDESFLRGEQKVILEDFVYGHEFSFYVITDGYKALPLTSVANYKFDLDGDGGLLTPGMGCYAPDYKVSFDNEQFIMNEIIYPTLETLAQNETPYVGILGVDAVLTPNNEIIALEFNTTLQEHDCQSVLSLLNEDLYLLLQACATGSFADDYSDINISDDFSVSAVLSSGRKSGAIIYGLDNLEESTKVAHFNTIKNKYLEYETVGGRSLLVTTNAKTISVATKKLYEELDVIDFEGKKYRKDLCVVNNY